jgi:hypothetical protein
LFYLCNSRYLNLSVENSRGTRFAQLSQSPTGQISDCIESEALSGRSDDFVAETMFPTRFSQKSIVSRSGGLTATANSRLAKLATTTLSQISDYGPNNDFTLSQISDYGLNNDFTLSQIGDYGLNNDFTLSQISDYGLNNDFTDRQISDYGLNDDFTDRQISDYGSNNDFTRGSENSAAQTLISVWRSAGGSRRAESLRCVHSGKAFRYLGDRKVYVGRRIPGALNK